MGYRLGFTVNSRNPLMVLPRCWDMDASIQINDVMQVGQEAAVYAEQNKATELEYYDIVCAPKYGPIP
ncbi:MAG: hypothetical protein NTV38_05385 [Chloroflexi bacterium]|nr:hypothetical protein [Chloroflexota bacterium]